MKRRLQCDIIMRGGITSGIVYPLAIAELAETYDFRSIGGSSAGAIAAAWTAAAAFARKRGHEDVFKTRIKTHPQHLARKQGGKTIFERLFQPQSCTRRLFNLFIASLERESKLPKRESKLSRLRRMVAMLYAEYPLFAFAGAACVLFPSFGIMLARDTTGWAHPILRDVCLVLIGLLAAVFSLLAAAAGVIRDICVQLPKNQFGVCSGSNNGIPDSCGVLPLTDWLHKFLQSLVDRPLTDPVTFGDLWNNGEKEDAERETELEFMTTNITRGISHRLPFLEGNWGQLFFKEEDLAQLFPPSIVTWMKKHKQDPRSKDVKLPEGYYGLPKPAKLPILFGARMSASFPFLLSAVPLYAVRITQANEIFLERCWFSDGGIASDFPIHFFDAPVPSRPTFAINFVPHKVDAAEIEEISDTLHRISGLETIKDLNKEESAWDRVWMPTKNTEGITSAARFNRFTSVGGFLSAVLDTALNWADTELMAMPGYRDRIVHVKLAPNEGGINLNMTQGTILHVSKYGECAGQLLAARFDPKPENDPKTHEPIELTWDNHRWIRYRSFMAAIEVLAGRFRSAWLDTDKPWRSYCELLSRKQGEKPISYPLERPEQYAFAVSATDQFVNLLADRRTKDQTFDRRLRPRTRGTPWPKAVLRVTPPGSNDPRA